MKLRLPKGLITLMLSACVAMQALYAESYTCTGDNDSKIHKLGSSDALIFNKESGYLTQNGGEINAAVTINNLKLTNGYSNTTYTFNNSISGEGEFSFQPEKNVTGQHYIFKGSMEGYSGNMIIATNKKSSFTFEGITSGTGTITATGDNYIEVYGATMKNTSIEVGTLKIKGTSSFTGSVTATNTNLIENTAVTFDGSTVLGTVTGSGTISLNGTSSSIKNTTFASGIELSITASDQIESITMISGSVLDISKLTLSASTPSIDTTKITLNSGVYVNVGNISNGDTLALFSSSVDGVKFKINGTKISEHSVYTESNGVYTFSSIAFAYTDLKWAGGNGEWNKTNENWYSETGGGNINFANDDSVTFDTTANVDVAEGVEVTKMTVSGNETTLSLTRSNGGYIGGTVSIEDGATMIIGSQTATEGFIHGEINVLDGTLQFDAKDVTGYNGGNSSTTKITIAADSKLVLNHANNETFAGTLVLNGTMKGDSESGAARWDLYGANATIQVEAGNHAVFDNVNLQLRRDNAFITIGSNASLTIGDLSENEGNGNLELKGAGELIVQGNTGINKIDITEKGTITFLKNANLATELRSLNGTINVGDSTNNVLLTTARLELGDAQSGSSTLNIASGSTIKVTGDKNGTDYGNVSLLLAEWVASTQVNLNGALIAAKAKALVGDSNVTININNGGTLAVAGIGIASVKSEKTQLLTLTLENGGKMILGEYGIADNLKTPSITLKNGTVGMSGESVTLGAAMTLSGDTGTTFDTAKYSFSSDGNSISQAENAEGGSMTVSGVLSGSGKLIKEGKGTLTLTADNTYSGGTIVNEGKLTANFGSSLGTGDITVAQDGIVEITEGGGTITIEAYKENTNAVVEKSIAYNNTAQDAILMGNAKVTANYNSDVTISNKIGQDAKSSAFVNKGTGKVTLTNGFNNMTHIHAQNGDINMQWIAYQGDVTALIIDDNRIIGAHAKGDEIRSIYDLATLTVTQAVTVGENASYYGNLVINSGASLTMDGAMNLYGTLTLNTGLELAGDVLTQIKALQNGDSLAIFKQVSDLVLNGTTETDVMTLSESALTEVDASLYFTNLEAGLYYITFENNTVSILSNIPEPTTATLSLLALAALAARRRRASR